MKIKAYHHFLNQRQDKLLYRSLARSSNLESIDFASNDYLGLSKNPEIIQSGLQAVEKYGSGATASRFVAGNLDYFLNIEHKLAQFKNKQAAFFLPSGFQTNIAVISALLDVNIFEKKPIVFCDKYNHASIYQAIQLSGAELVRFRHNDFNHLETLLKKYSSEARPLFVITESVFSMDGDRCDFDILLQLAKHYEAFTIIDDAHSVGILGTQGRGLTVDYPDIDVVIGTASKAMGFQGGYVACRRDIMDYLHNAAQGFIYSTAVSPFLFGCLDKALDIIPLLDAERQKVLSKADDLRHRLNHLGIETLNSTTQIVPAVFKDNKTVLDAETKLQAAGFHVKSIRSPTVPANSPRLRLSLKPSISLENIDKLMAEIETVFQKR